MPGKVNDKIPGFQGFPDSMGTLLQNVKLSINRATFNFAE